MHYIRCTQTRGLKRVWAPWRATYFKKAKEPGCCFCRALKNPERNFVVYQSRLCFCLLNIYPYNNGHLMVVPRRHIAHLSLLTDEETLDMFAAVRRMKECLDKILRPSGYNIGMNLAVDAGAGITGHLHLHIVPRWRGDTNFMPVLSDSKVISQSLTELCSLIRAQVRDALSVRRKKGGGGHARSRAK
jgi:ATP adenylyltransferase